MGPAKVKVGLIQFSPSENSAKNLEISIRKIRSASSRGAQILCLPELFLTPYFCQKENRENFSLAESIPGKTTSLFCELAREISVVLIVPFFEKSPEGDYFNSAAVIDADGTLLGTYRKSHIPEETYYHEKYYFSPGDSGFKVFETCYGRIGVLICWDQWFPEAARACALQGAQILFYPTAIAWSGAPTQAGELEAWQLIQRSHAISNHLFVAAVNRTGHEDELHFWGHSFIAGPFGEILASSGEEEVDLISECYLEKIEKDHAAWPFFRDRRPELYHSLIQSIPQAFKKL